VSDDLAIEVAGEQVVLLPERGLFYPRADALLIADAHWGKAAAFQAHFIPVPEGSVQDDLNHLDAMLTRTGATQLYILGDLLHAAVPLEAAVSEPVVHWRARHPELSVTLVRGNHDRADPPPEWGIQPCDGPIQLKSFVLAHQPQESEASYVLAGHLHPAVWMTGKGKQRIRLPCFWFGQRVGVLPAFGSFTGGSAVRSAATDRVFALAGGSVVLVH
jgi:DNA ligase-associated metallophosphoesterase